MKAIRYSMAALVLAGLMAGCKTAPPTEQGKDKLADDVDLALSRMYREDSSLKDFVNNSAGYVVFPSVGKGGLIVGGAYGRGIVYQGGNAIGYADISQATVGAQAGGQEFSELVVFETDRDIQRFKAGKFALAANASAVALKSGAAKTARFQEGTAVFVRPVAGAMVEASIGGQSIDYIPKDEAQRHERNRNDRNDRYDNDSPTTRDSDDMR